MNNRLLAFGFLITPLLSPSVSHAIGCESGMSPMSAYASMLSNFPLIEGLMKAPDKVNKATTEAELQEAVRRINSTTDIVERLGRETAGCLSDQESKLLIRDVRRKHNFTSAKDMVNSALASANKAKSLYPSAEIRIQDEAKKRQEQITKLERENALAQEKLEAEKKSIAELEINLRNQLELDAQRQTAEKNRLAIEAQLADVPRQSNATSSDSVGTTTTQPFSSGLNNSRAGDGYIKKNRVICFSKSSHDRQIELLVDGVKEFAKGCFSTPENQNAWRRDVSWGECVVERVSDRARIWIDCGDFVSW